VRELQIVSSWVSPLSTKRYMRVMGYGLLKKPKEIQRHLCCRNFIYPSRNSSSFYPVLSHKNSANGLVHFFKNSP